MTDVASHYRRAAGRTLGARRYRASERHAGFGSVSRHSPTVRAAGLAMGVLFALAGCETPASGQDADKTAQAETVSADTDGQVAEADGQVAEAQLTTADCKIPSEGRVHFRVGGTELVVPGDDVRTVLPPDVTPDTPASKVVEQLQTATEQGAGCPEKPLAAALLAVAGPTNAPLIGNEILLFRPRGSVEPYGELMRRMLANRDKCQTTDGGLLACQAVRGKGEQQTRTLYLISTDPDLKLAFGGPLAARCIVAQKKIRSCEILDELPGGVGVRAPLTSMPQSDDALATAHQAVLATIRSLRP